jgi:hypothetical protein
MEDFIRILSFILDSFLHIWPYLLITIPVAVAVQLTDLGKYVSRIIGLNPVAAIIIATLIGALSPLCSCGVIPVITALLIGGVPVAPVMSFWIASPSMDPEIFFLSIPVIGARMSLWRLAATFLISLAAGFLTHLLIRSGWLKTNDILIFAPSQECGTCGTVVVKKMSLRRRIMAEVWKVTWTTSKFMALAFLINAIITLYLPADLLNGMLMNDGPFTVVIAAVLGIPAYTSNITALPMVSGLMAIGMNPGAALAFLIAGPVTTLPAMSAVWGLVSRKLFLLYLIIPLTGAILFGLMYNMFLQNGG